MSQLDDMQEISVKEITIPQARLRETMHDIGDLAASMEAVGLLNPITVSNEQVLITGLHRVRAAQHLGWETIAARIFTGDDIGGQLAEIDENLVRHDLTVAERSHHIARREEIMKARGERATGGGDGSNQYQSNPATVAGLLERTTEDLARQAGVSERTYQRSAHIGRGLTEETQAVISELDPQDCALPNSTSQLDYLAGVNNPEDQAEIASVPSRRV